MLPSRSQPIPNSVDFFSRYSKPQSNTCSLYCYCVLIPPSEDHVLASAFSEMQLGLKVFRVLFRVGGVLGKCHLIAI
jgi:hypothetical protein